MIGKPKARRRGERGVAMVETAMVVPILLLLAMGIYEFASGWQANLTVQTSIRSAARTGSGLGKDRDADYSMISALKAGLTDFQSADIQRVVIFKANSVNGTVPTQCLSGTTGQDGICNVYTGAQINSYGPGKFGGTPTSCASNARDRFWCPTDRNNTQIDADYVGVWVQVLYRYRSGAFPGTGITMEKTMVMRIEPKQS